MMGIREVMEISNEQGCDLQSYPAKKFNRFKWFITKMI